MQIGTRWRCGDPVPSAVPHVFAEGLRAAEAEARLSDGVWLLTWLEGRPVAEHSGGLHLVADAQGRAVPADAVGGAVAGGDGTELDDDDWL